MTRDDILMMAKEAGIDAWWDSGDENREVLQDHLEHFAGLAAQHEREACARIVEHYTGAWSDEGYALTQAIRARGEK